ncbi:MAG: glycosyltransferase family 39 protein [Chloroflexota bacterium]
MWRDRVLIIIILGIGAVLRFWQLSDAPAWYTDEATHIEIARHLLMGEVRYFAVADSWLLFARLPLFEIILTGLFAVTDVSMLVLRSLTVGCGLLGIVLLYLMLRDVGDARFALMGAFIFAILPQAILYNRFGFSYSLLQPLLILMIWGGVRYTLHHRQWLLMSVIAFGLASLTDVLAWSFIVPLAIIIMMVRWCDIFWALPLAMLPLSLYGLLSLWFIPEAFLFDLQYTLSRTSVGTLTSQWITLQTNIQVLLSNPWWVLAGIGIITLKQQRLLLISLLFLIPLLLIARTVPLYSLSAYYLIPFLPIVAIGVASLFVRGWDYLQTVQYPLVRVLIISVFSLGLFGTIVQTIMAIHTDYPTAIDPFLIEAEAAREVAEFVNGYADDNQIIVTSAPIGWLLNHELQVTEFQMASIADGRDAIHVPANLPAERLVIQAGFADTDILVVDNLWRNWGAVHIPQIAEVLAHLDDWQAIYSAGQITVYERE